MVECPRCNSPAKLTGKEWEYSRYYVKQCECLGCKKRFLEYYRDDKISHTIPKDATTLKYPIGVTRKITAYLKEHKCVSFDQIVKDLQLDDYEVIDVLSKLEMSGLVEKIDDST